MSSRPFAQRRHHDGHVGNPIVQILRGLPFNAIAATSREVAQTSLKSAAMGSRHLSGQTASSTRSNFADMGATSAISSRNSVLAVGKLEFSDAPLDPGRCSLFNAEPLRLGKCHGVAPMLMAMKRPVRPVSPMGQTPPKDPFPVPTLRVPECCCAMSHEDGRWSSTAPSSRWRRRGNPELQSWLAKQRHPEDSLAEHNGRTLPTHGLLVEVRNLGEIAFTLWLARDKNNRKR